MDLQQRLEIDPERLSVVRCESRASSEADRRALGIVYEAMYAERWRPDDSPSVAVEAERLRTQVFPDRSAFWIGLLDHRHVVGGAMSAPTPSADPPRASVVLYVAPIARRHGLGSRLMTAVLERGNTLGQKVYEAVSSTRAPEGGAWARRLGACANFEGCTQQLLVEDLDVPRLDAGAGRADACGVELRATSERYSDAELRAVAALMEQLRKVAKRDQESQPLDTAVALLRKNEDTLAGRGIERWTSIARSRSTGEIVGFSVAFYNPQLPRVLEHMATAVVQHSDERTLDELLKLSVLRSVVNAIPAIRFIRTSVPAEAASVLATNHAIGFRDHHRFTRWQAEAAAFTRHLKLPVIGKELLR